MATSQTSGNPLFLRSGCTISPSQALAIDHLLADLVEKLSAHFALLTDTSGQVIATHGRQTTKHGSPIDPAALGALAAGDLAASQEMARITGEYQDYQLILRLGAESHLLISEVGRSFVFLAQVGDEVLLGWARIHILNAARHMAEVLLSTPEQMEPAVPELNGEQLGDMVNSTLDSMWREEPDVR